MGIGTPQLLLVAVALVFSIAAADSPAVSFSFNFSNPSTYNQEADLKFEGDATPPRDGLVNLTCSMVGCKGRMSYAQPVHLYDNATTVVASFSTRFTFAIIRSDRCKGDGMAFFLASYPSVLPPSSSGGSLGLIAGPAADGKTTALGADRFIAVEFDTYNNSFDPKGSNDHIGIDISSVQMSINTTLLPNFSLHGIMTADITFDNRTRMLVASLWWLDDKNDPSPTKPVQVSTQLPEIQTLLPPEVAVGFSAATGSCRELHQIMSWTFNSTLARIHKERNKIPGLLGGLIIGGVVALALALWFLLSCWKWKRVLNFFRKGTAGARRFEYHDLATATKNFSDVYKLGEGAFGKVYRGYLQELHRDVAVKKIVKELNVGHKDFFSEVTTISEARHKNLVKFYGWCIRGHSWNILHFLCGWCWSMEKKELFLVYELMKNGNLHEYLHESKVTEVQSWRTRYKIAKDIGSALFYLHHDCKPCILHRDIKPCNILLDENFNAKLADFGLSRIAKTTVVGTVEGYVLTTAAGPIDYMDPQCKKHGKVRIDCPSDVYSFGIVLLEITCTGKSREQICGLYRSKGDVVKAADTRLEFGGDSERRKMERVIVLGLLCSAFETRDRPTMQQAMDVLERNAPLPDHNFITNSALASSDHDASSASVANI
uniref:non-specific serine/threonine protein kinase n=1 Tax=Oryza barthii TaxID=65489 RepID=A0A0D3FS77_9ORYZ